MGGVVARGPLAEEVDLREVEVWFDAVAGIGFVHGEGGWAEVETVVFAADLEEGSFWGYGCVVEGGEEVGEEGDVLGGHCGGVGPEGGVGEGWGLDVGGEVDVVGVGDVVGFEDLGDFRGGAGEEVDGDGDDVGVVWVLGWAAGEGVDFVPARWVFGEDFQHG